MSRRWNDRFAVLGVGAAACVACCAGPAIGLIAGLSAIGIAAFAFGFVLIAGGIAAVIGAIVLRRRRAARSMKRIPIYDETAPIACTATKDEIPVRLEVIERMHRNLSHIERTEHGLRLAFPNTPDVAADLRQFAVDEKGCCQFWGFAIENAADQLTLRWDGPPAVEDFMDRLHEYFEGDDAAAVVALL